MFFIQTFPNKSFWSCNTVKPWCCFAPDARLMSMGNHNRQKKKKDVGTAASSQSTVEHESKPTILRFQLGKSHFKFWTLKSNFIQLTGLFKPLLVCFNVLSALWWTGGLSPVDPDGPVSHLLRARRDCEAGGHGETVPIVSTDIW